MTPTKCSNWHCKNKAVHQGQCQECTNKTPAYMEELRKRKIKEKNKN